MGSRTRTRRNRKWTRESVVSELRRLYKSGEDIRSRNISSSCGGLYSAGIRYFGDYSSLCRAAGIDIDRFQEEMKKAGRTTRSRRRYTRDYVVSELRRLNSVGEDIRPGTLRETHPGLLNAGYRHFGDIRDAYSAAGLAPSSLGVNRRWTKEKVVTAIIAMARDGRKLNYAAVHQNNLPLAEAARKLFVDWDEALRAAGFEPDRHRILKRSDHWTRCKIVEDVASIWRREGDVSSSYCVAKHGDLVNAGRRRFGSWEAAVRAAGLDYDVVLKHERRLSKEDVIQRLNALRDQGISLSWHSVRTHDATVAQAARARFGSYQAAIEALGIDYDTVGRISWTPEKCLEGLRKSAAANETLDLINIQNRALYKASIRYYGSFRKAVEVAGLDPNVLISTGAWTRESIIKNIQILNTMGEDLSASHMQAKHNKLIASARTPRYFGSWENAVHAAGLDYDSIRKKWAVEAFKGHIFEGYVKKAFKALSWQVVHHKRFSYEYESCTPDFYDPSHNAWIDAKLDCWGSGVEPTVEKYLRYSDKLTIIYLTGKGRTWEDDSVSFVPIRSFYDRLRAEGAGELVVEIEMLRRGVLNPRLQARLIDYVSKRSPDIVDEVAREIAAKWSKQ